MSDLIERIKKRIEDEVDCEFKWCSDCSECHRDVVIEKSLKVIDEELAKEPQECEWVKGIKLKRAGVICQLRELVRNMVGDTVHFAGKKLGGRMNINNICGVTSCRHCFDGNCNRNYWNECEFRIAFENQINMSQESDSDCISRKKLIEAIQEYLLVRINGNESFGNEERAAELRIARESIIKLVNNQPQVNPIVSKAEIVRTPEEIAEIFFRYISCNNDCPIINSCKCNCVEDCRKHWLDWLTKKEV